jgi:hypothetical protein
MLANHNDRLLTVDEASAILNVSKDFLSTR